LPSLDWLSVTRQTINHALAYSRRRIEKAIARARSDGKTIDWHRLRKRVRRLIQQYAALDELHIDGVTHPFEIVKERERKLAKQLGRAQDCVLLLERCRKPSIFGGDRKIVSTLAHAKLERSRRKAARLIAGHATCADW
jgi:biotin operon repressor